jgi:hypothetical protein
MVDSGHVCNVDLDGKRYQVGAGLRLVRELMADLGLDPEQGRLGTLRAGDLAALQPEARLSVTNGDKFRALSLLVYVPSDKHKSIPTGGVKGTICPPGVDAQALLDASETHPSRPGKRFSTDGEHCYAAHEDARGGWHGWPCTRQEVPEQLWRRWIRDGKLTRRRAN